MVEPIGGDDLFVFTKKQVSINLAPSRDTHTKNTLKASTTCVHGSPLKMMKLSFVLRIGAKSQISSFLALFGTILFFICKG